MEMFLLGLVIGATAFLGGWGLREKLEKERPLLSLQELKKDFDRTIEEQIEQIEKNNTTEDSKSLKEELNKLRTLTLLPETSSKLVIVPVGWKVEDFDDECVDWVVVREAQYPFIINIHDVRDKGEK